LKIVGLKLTLDYEKICIVQIVFVFVDTARSGIVGFFVQAGEHYFLYTGDIAHFSKTCIEQK